MKSIITLLVVFLLAVQTVPVSAKEKPPFKYTNYQSYVALDGTVTLRKYRYDYEINDTAKGAPNPFVGKKIKSIKKVGASDEQNKWIWEVYKRCGSIDAVFMVEAESGWVLDKVGYTGDLSLFQWSPEHQKKIIRNKNFWTWEYQVQEGCRLFNERANVNQITLNPFTGEWRSGESHTWRAMPKIYTQNIKDQFFVEFY